MIKMFINRLPLLLGFVFMSCMLHDKSKITIYLVGDSTIANKEIRAYPETGWGMPFTNFFDSSVVIDNRAKNGRSTKSFIGEGLWQPIVANLKKGDYVLIQFGHNDEVKTKATYTTEEEFKSNLKKYCTDTKSKGAYPVLITPVARRKFDSTGRIQGTHDVYSGLVRDVAKEYDIPLIDLDKKSQELLQNFGVENSKLLFNHLEVGEHPNYPNGKIDDTHFSELGARRMAELVLANIRNLKPELAERIAKPVKN
jgi:lysophospholipase L1-like esterase